MSEKEELKHRLRQAMVYKGINATELSEKIGITKSAMSYYLSGRSEPKANRLYVLAKALDVSEAWLLGYDVPIDRAEDLQEKCTLEKLSERIAKNREFRQLIMQINQLNLQQVESIKALLSAFNQQRKN